MLFDCASLNPRAPFISQRDQQVNPLNASVLLQHRPDYYAAKRHSPEDTLLVVEVSDTTLRYDRNRKAPLYAKSGVTELWIENLEGDVILVFGDPGPDGYSTTLLFRRGESISLLAFPDILFKVDELLG